jgi:cobalt-zinc-cadmium resistance protein CzcA
MQGCAGSSQSRLQSCALRRSRRWLFTRLGQEFVPTLDEKDIAMHAMRIPSTGITQSQGYAVRCGAAVSSSPEVAFVYSKTGTAEMATDPMPPNVSDTFIIFKPKEPVAQRGGARPAHR